MTFHCLPGAVELSQREARVGEAADACAGREDRAGVRQEELAQAGG